MAIHEYDEDDRAICNESYVIVVAKFNGLANNCDTSISLHGLLLHHPVLDELTACLT